ncbi:hypothetical protein RvY_09264 [Ramazzottius varieornatus]|uniref:non-specific serine/threonine protein kinase n=1 Tax=Ramazzottius varieornatus TaxID=947166 RepID=A0A1D1VE98_RAMVA|nr:hypothetical protein RvY_09264 [Ramazzottius varieornatus]
MAPEVIACEQQLDSSYDARSDVWSVGIVGIELADGERMWLLIFTFASRFMTSFCVLAAPLAHLHPMRALFKIPRSPPPTLKNPKNWSFAFVDFVQKCLTKNYLERPTPKELLQHPFMLQAKQTTAQVQAKLRSLLLTLHGPERMAPSRLPAQAMTKHGKLKADRKSPQEMASCANDLASLEILDENTIVDTLSNRFNNGQIYTYVGDILIAVNPFTELPIYTDEVQGLYNGCSKQDKPPHIFGISDSAYHTMLQSAQNQVVVISGESGSGKTENAKYLIQHLTRLGRTVNKTLEQKILIISTAMEAFGNAKTGLNENSSRFGKYMELLFSKAGHLSAVRLSEYLLEKGRVVHQAPNEENFHVFYYVYDGLSRATNLPNSSAQDFYNLKPRHGHNYLNKYTGDNAALVSAHRAKFALLHDHLQNIGFNLQELTSVYRVLAAILHLGDIQFQSAQEVRHMDDRSVISNVDTLVTVAKLLAINIHELSEALTRELVVTKGESINRHLSTAESRNVRDSLAKALYGRLFDWIVNQINRHLSATNPQAHGSASDPISSVAILDIFGFENFKTNSVEQMYINITNEQLQYFFNHTVFTWEQKEYAEEGLDWIPIVFCDNRPVLDLFLSKPVGILALMDEESRFPKSTDQSLAEKFEYNLRSSSLYQRNRTDGSRFLIEHYAGKIEYSVHGFLEKNRDYLATDIIRVMRTSEIPLLGTLFHNLLSRTGNLCEGVATVESRPLFSSSVLLSGALGGLNISRNQNKRLRTLASQTKAQQSLSTHFRYSLMDLLSKIVAGNPHFIRCIKPNDEMAAGFFCYSKVKLQLCYAGVLETARIRREGHAYRVTFSDFLKRYYVLAFSWNRHIQSTADSCKAVLRQLQIPESGWVTGRTKVFLKHYVADQLSVKLNLLITAATRIQTRFRGWMARKRYLDYLQLRKHCATTIQKVFRGWIVRRRCRHLIHQRRKLKHPNIVMQVQVPDKMQANRKRPCSSPLSETEQLSPVPHTKHQPPVQEKPLAKNLKRVKDNENFQAHRHDIDMESLPSSSNKDAHCHPPRDLPPSSKKQISRKRSSNISDVVEPAESTDKQSTRCSRVKAFIAAFEKGGTSDSASVSSRPPCWKKQDRTAHSVERMAQQSPARVLGDITNQNLVKRAPSFHGQMRSEVEVEPLQINIRQTAEDSRPHFNRDSQVQGVPAETMHTGVASPDSFGCTDNNNDFRKVLRKTSFNPVSPSFAKSYEPVSQVDFRNVLRNNRR